MAEAVAEALAVAGGVDHVARHGVHRRAAAPGAHGGQRVRLRAPHQLVDLLGRRPSSGPVAIVRVQSEQ